MKLVSDFKYFVAGVAGILCLATGANAENIDFGQAQTGYPYQPEKKAASTSVSSIDLGSTQRTRIGGPIKIRDYPQLLQTGNSSKHAAEKLFRSAIHKQNTNDLSGAIADYQAVIKIDGNDPAVHWYLGTAYEAAGKATEANQEFEKEQAMHRSGDRQKDRLDDEDDFLDEGDFGSNKLKFVPDEGLTKPHSDGK